MPTGVPLNESVIITLNGAGAGTAKVGPLGAREVWYPSGAHVNTTQVSVVNEATCTISVGDSNTRDFRDTTFSGSSGDATDMVNGDVVKVGQYVWAQWSGGDAGVQATLTVTGSKDI